MKRAILVVPLIFFLSGSVFADSAKQVTREPFASINIWVLSYPKYVGEMVTEYKMLLDIDYTFQTDVIEADIDYISVERPQGSFFKIVNQVATLQENEAFRDLRSRKDIKLRLGPIESKPISGMGERAIIVSRP